MTVIQQMHRIQAVWTTMIPHIAMPEAQDIAHWLEFQPASIDLAIARTAKKFAPSKVVEPFNPQQAYRYTTAAARIVEDRMEIKRMLAKKGE